MSKLSRKAKAKKKLEESNGKKIMLYLFIGLLIIALIVGIFVM